MKEKRSEISARCFLIQSVGIADLIEYGLARIQSLMLLGEVTDLDATANLKPPRRLKLPNEDLQEGCLADTVLTDKCHTVTLTDEQGDVIEDALPTRIGKADVLELRHTLCALRRFRKCEILEARRLGRQYDPLETIQLALPPACLLRLDARLVARNVLLGFLDM